MLIDEVVQGFRSEFDPLMQTIGLNDLINLAGAC